MKKWRNFFLQRMGENGNGSSYPVCESVQTWGIWCKDIPFKLFDKIKEPARRTWNDEHGDDEYIGDDGLYVEAYTMTVEFGCKKMGAVEDNGDVIAAVNDVRERVGAFLEYLRSSGMMMLYSSHTRIGRQNVRLSSIDDSATWQTDDNGEFLLFSVSFKVNDPMTDVVMNNGVLIATV